MKNRREVLIAHYSHLLRTVATKAAVIAMVLTSLIIPTASQAAGQITTRSTLLSNSAGGGTSSYTATFTLASSAQTIGAFKLEICDSPLSTTTCANTGNSLGATFTGATFGSTTCGGANPGSCNGTAFAGGTFSGNAATVTHTAIAATATPTVVIVVNGVTNPTAPNKSFYVRISSYNNTAATTPTGGTDFGATAVSTTAALAVSANVQESLTFCTGTSGANCAAITGTTVNVGTTTDNILTNGTPSGGVSLMYVDTNASSGYSITYTTATNFVSGANTIQSAASQPMATCASGSANGDCFGVNLAANTATGLATSAAPTGGTVPSVNAGYATADSYRFVSGSAQQVATTAGPTSTTTIKASYAAQAGPTTKPGAYSTTFTWIATGTF